MNNECIDKSSSFYHLCAVDVLAVAKRMLMTGRQVGAPQAFELVLLLVCSRSMHYSQIFWCGGEGKPVNVAVPTGFAK